MNELDHTDHTDPTDHTIGVQHLSYSAYSNITHRLRRVSEPRFYKRKKGGAHNKSDSFGKTSTTSLSRKSALKFPPSGCLPVSVIRCVTDDGGDRRGVLQWGIGAQ